MKRMWMAALLALFVGAGAWAADAFKEYKSEMGAFSVLFPGAPMEEKKTADTPAGKMDVYLFTARADQIVFLVGYQDYPEETIKEVGAEATLEADRDSFAKAVGGMAAEEKKIKLDGNPGIEFVVSTNGGGRLLVREYLVKNRLFQVVAGAQKEKVGSPDVKKFLDSFKLIKADKA